MTENRAAVRVRGLEKSYLKGRTRIDVLKGVDLEIESGSFVAIMGPSGSGKTTLLNLISGLDRPDGGEVEVAGTRVDRLARRRLGRWRARHVGLVFQISNLLPVFTAERNVELPLLLTDLSRRERRRRVATALDLVGMSQRAEHYPRELSGGEEQRVGIARAIVTDPLVLVCDEPTGDLDRERSDEVLRLLKALNTEQQKTVIMVTHDPSASAFADRTVHLAGGMLQEPTSG